MGQAGAASSVAGRRSNATLLSRIRGQHVRAQTRASTFARTMAAVLRDSMHLDLAAPGLLTEGAVAEYDQLGQDEFLARHRFGRARAYLLILDGKATTPRPSSASRINWRRGARWARTTSAEEYTAQPACCVPSASRFSTSVIVPHLGCLKLP